MKSSGNISLSCLSEGSGEIDALIFFDVSQRRTSSQVQTTSRLLPLPLVAFIRRAAKASTLTETTLKQLEVLSQMLRLMSKPNKNSKRLKANIVDWTPSALSVNLSLSELQLNQIKIPRWRHKSRHGYVHGHTCRNAIHTGFGAGFGVLVLLSEWCPGGCGEAERGLSSSAAPLFTLMVSRC